MINNLLNLFFPSVCPVCGSGSDSHGHNPVCVSCWKAIGRYSGPACQVCGIPTASAHALHCASCLQSPPPFSKIIYYGVYEKTLKEAVHLLKFHGLKRLARPLALLLSELPIPESDGIVPVPLHPGRLREREFNQTAVIGRHLSRHLGIPLLLDILQKKKETPPQTAVTGKERSQNIKNVFSADSSAAGLRLVLVDDVVTTGATVHECAGVLKKAGAASVTVVALARSMPW